MSSPPPVVDPSRCPLCGQPNACDMACRQPSGNCWCVNATFTPALLARVPESHRRLACICHACVGSAAHPAPEGPSG